MTKNTFRPQLECVEDRLALSTVSLSGGTLSISGSNYNDTVVVSYKTGPIFGIQYVSVKDNGVEKLFFRSLVSKINFYGNGGSDVFNNLTNVDSYANGGSGTDYLYGGGANDVFYGGWDNSNDYLYGYGGNDSLYGEGGNDVISGGTGNDYLSGSVGNDALYGGSGRVALNGRGS